jgi:hypothetical protein
MQALLIPTGIIKHIDRIRRGFLWKGKEVATSLTALVCWEKVCSLKKNGGMGVINLRNSEWSNVNEMVVEIEVRAWMFMATIGANDLWWDGSNNLSIHQNNDFTHPILWGFNCADTTGSKLALDAQWWALHTQQCMTEE